ncbi:MAG: ribose-phosphate diphosphokinase [Patescibacteria group bacterium]|jgi:ribose-phosphate pyrophosphokinase
MKFFSTEILHPLSRVLSKSSLYKPGTLELRRYDNREMYITNCSPVNGEAALLFGSFTPPDDSLFGTLLAAHTLKKEGAKSVLAILPFAAYTRHDKVKSGLSLTTAWVGSLAKASGIDTIITIDLHSEHDRELMPVELVSLSPAPLFGEEIRKKNWTDATLVAPDNGAIPRCEAVARALQSANPVAYFKKERTPDGVTVHDLVGEVGKRCVLIDDQLDTGATLLQACRQLQDKGVEEILIMVTHGLFTGEAWKELKDVGVQEIIVTDTLAPRTNMPWVSVISVAPLLGQALKEYVETN